MPTLLDPPPCATDDSDLEMLCAADYPATEVQWLWPNRIPIGKVTLLVGDPGNGKSLVALDIAARVSRGAAWPDLPPSALPLPPSHSPASVLILSAEDDIRDTIRPRLDAAGADPRRVFVLPAITDLRHDLTKLRAALDRLPDCRLIVIDPINSYVGPGDSHFHTIVRRVFEPLAKLAAERGIAVLAVSHLRKHEGAAIQRAVGSMGFVAAARAVWTVCRDPVQADRYLLLQVKNNFVAETPGLAYAISSTNQDGDSSSAPAITWHQEPVSTAAVEVLEQAKKARGPEPAELTLAMNWLQQELVHGPKLALFVYAEGVVSGGFEERTLRRALIALGGRSRKLGFLGDWEWYLPDYDFPSRPEMEIDRTAPAPEPLDRNRRNAVPAVDPDPSENLSTSEETCPLRENTHVPQTQAGPLREESPTLQGDPLETEPRLPVPLDADSPVRTYPPNPDFGTRKLWPERTWALLTHKNPPDGLLSFEAHLTQSKLMRILKSRSRLGGVRPILGRVEIDLLKPFTFDHPQRCRAP